VHGLLSLQSSAAPAWQLPPEQTSPAVQAFPSLHAAALFACAQPVAGLHASSVQGLLSSQLGVPAPGWQLPPEHTSPVVQAFPSLHTAVLLAWMQPVAGTHESSVHGLLSLQSSVPAPAWQLPPEHTSPVVQAFPSVHATVLLA
jgi:hypothetical protein